VYSAETLDHFQNPRNGGKVESPDARARLENPACGDVLELSLRLENNFEGECKATSAQAGSCRVAEIRFMAKGCVPTMACGSALTELVKGKSLAAARLVSREELLRELGGLPQASSHASHLALDTLASLLGKL
jgi:nitrogen fixation protein NifU and related proteins